MTNEDKLKEIERLWTLSKMTYIDSRWLIDRIKVLTEALEKIASDSSSHIKVKDLVFEAKEALNKGYRPGEEKE